ncbi:hypothetical protein EMMF5_000052 [Cystobasidiomycetes sp. EMM_F5]
MFYLLAYMAIAPVVILILLDIGGYLVWRIYDQPFWSGTRTAFYKFRTSPVFSRSTVTSPIVASKPVLHSTTETETREISLSPVSSSASLQDFAMTSEADTASSSPVMFLKPLASIKPESHMGASVRDGAGQLPLRQNSLGLGLNLPERGGSSDPPTPTSVASPVLLSIPSSSGNSDDDDQAFTEAKQLSPTP